LIIDIIDVKITGKVCKLLINPTHLHVQNFDCPIYYFYFNNKRLES